MTTLAASVFVDRHLQFLYHYLKSFQDNITLTRIKSTMKDPWDNLFPVRQAIPFFVRISNCDYSMNGFP